MKNSIIKSKYIKITISLFVIAVVVIAAFLAIINYLYGTQKEIELMNYLTKNQFESIETINQDAYLLGFKNSIDEVDDKEFLKLSKSDEKLKFNQNVAKKGEFVALKYDGNIIFYELNDSVNWNFIIVLATILIVIVIIFAIYSFIIVSITDKLIIKKIHGISNNVSNNQILNKLKSKNENEIDQLIASLIEYNILEEKMINEKKLLVQAFSHELKTPLQNISAIMYLMEEEVYPLFDGTVLVEKEILKAKENIESALNVFSETGVGNKNVKVDLLLENIKKENEAVISKKDLIIVFELEALEIQCDPKEVSLVINNLFNNSIRHAKISSVIEITLLNGVVKIKNVYEKEIEGKKITYGNKIVKYIVQKNNWEIKKKILEDVYIVALKLM